MEEWSNKQKYPPQKNSLANIYKDLLSLSSCRYNPESKKPQKTLDIVQQKAKSLNLNNLSFKLCYYKNRDFITKSNDYALLLKTRHLFIKFMACQHGIECKKLGLDDSEIKQMRQGIIPENINVHLKIPFDFGGECIFENMALIRTHPHHLYLHRLIECQFEQGILKQEKQLFVPVFEGFAYYG